MQPEFDLVIIGAGAGGLVAADFARALGAKVAIVEGNRIGGDCTWTGCVPSKALLKAAKIAHDVRTAGRYGITSSAPQTDMAQVRGYVNAAIAQIYLHTTPEQLQHKGVHVFLDSARFVDSSTIVAGDRSIRSKKFLITTGARPFVPPIVGLAAVPYFTYEGIFDNERLPRSMLVIGAGPVGAELAQAYQRLGAKVTVIADRLLPKEDLDVRDLVAQVFEREGVRFVRGRATAARKDGETIVLSTGQGEVRGDLLLVAAGRRPTVHGLDLENAGVEYTERGIKVDDRLRTSARNIYAAGDAAGGCQFSHFAGWQAFQAVRNALLPGSRSGVTVLVPRVTFTAPEVAQVGFTEEQARAKFGERLKIRRWTLSQVDRAVCENDQDGFFKVIAKADGTIVGATIVAERAGETIGELVMAINNKLRLNDIAATIHAYPTYSSGIQLLAAEATLDTLFTGISGSIIRRLSALAR